jgi:hypothetical protein
LHLGVALLKGLRLETNEKQYVAGLRAHICRHPDVVHRRVVFEGGNYFRNPTLLEFIAENPTRHGTLPPNITDVASVILQAGVTQSALDETLALVASSNVAHECGAQTPLISLLVTTEPTPAARHERRQCMHSSIARKR